MSRRLLPALTLTALSVTLFATGCAPWATYPPVEHTSKLVNPTFEPIPTLMASSVRYVHDEHAAMQQVVFNLPDGMSARAYELVQKKLPEARPMQSGDTIAYHVTAIRTRGPEAEVDVIVPRPDGLHELETVHFKQKFGKGYQVSSSRQWRLRVEPPMPNYQPPAQQTEMAGVADDGQQPQ